MTDQESRVGPSTEPPNRWRSPAGWQQVRQIFDDALPLAAGAREAFLVRTCGDDPELLQEVQSLLVAHDEAGVFIENPRVSLDGADSAGARLGNYLLEELLGRGGMGEVYRARRADREFEQRVAVKILKRGMDTDEIVRRFRSERQILARLEHPNIARLIDGGSTDDGRPYLVMEFVDGKPIDQHCDDEGFGVEARLRLFLRVCRAVQFAHQHLVIHRDIKPSNLWVTAAGEPKLLDFGVAKILDPGEYPVTVAPTVAGVAPMTPEYASPEQIHGETVTTASDVYSLGVLLYELLTGRRPIPLDGLTREAQLRALSEGEPVRPSSAIVRSPPIRDDAPRLGDPARLRRRLVGDLDTILLEALHRDPARRYGTVDALAGDIERHLAGRPVSARRDSWRYRFGKLVARHKLAFGSAVVALLALVAFTSALWIQRDRILEEQRRASTVVELLVGLFETPDPFRGHGERVTVRDALARGVDDLDRRLEGEPEIQADLLQTLGRTYANLALYDEARPLLERSLSLRREIHGARHPAVAEGLERLADLDVQEGEYRRAEERYSAALDLREGLQGPRHPARVESLHGLAVALDLGDRRQEAAETYRRALDLARRLDGGERSDTLAHLLDHYAEFLREQDAYDEARSAAEEALAILRQERGDNHPDVALVLNNLALIEKHSDPQLARRLLEQAEGIQRRAFGRPHAHLALTLINLGRLLHDAQDLDAAQRRLEEAAAIQLEVYRGPHPRRATTLDLLAGVEADLGDLEGAIGRRREVLALRQELFGDDHVETARSCNSLAGVLVDAGRLDEAETLYRRSLDIVRARFGDSHRHVAVLLNNLGELAEARGRLAEAEQRFTESLEILRQTVDPGSHLLALTLPNLGGVQRRRGDFEAAERHLEEAHGIAVGRWGEESPRVAEIRVALAALRNDQGSHAEAESEARQALAVFGDRPTSGRQRLQSAIAELQLARALAGAGRGAEAGPRLRGALETLRSSPSARAWVAEAEALSQALGGAGKEGQR